MLTKKAKIVIYILLSCLLLACVIGVCTIKKSDSTVVAVDVQDFNSNTNKVVFYDGEKIDTLMIGKWQHCMDTTWFRVYTTEPAGDGYYWGKEWNTSEDIFEEDLMPYGNGWFKWKKDDKSVMEFQMTEIKGIAIPYEYKVMQLNPQQLQFKENFSSKKHFFRKIS